MKRELRRCPCQGCRLRLEAQASGDWAHALAKLAEGSKTAKLTAGRKRARLTQRRWRRRKATEAQERRRQALDVLSRLRPLPRKKRQAAC